MKLSTFFAHWRQDLSSDQVANMYKIRGVELPIGFFRTPEIHKELVNYGATLVEVFDTVSGKWYPAPYIQCKNCKKIKKWFHFRGDRLVNNSIKRPYMDHVCGVKNLKQHQAKQDMLESLQQQGSSMKGSTPVVGNQVSNHQSDLNSHFSAVQGNDENNSISSIFGGILSNNASPSMKNVTNLTDKFNDKNIADILSLLSSNNNNNNNQKSNQKNENSLPTLVQNQKPNSISDLQDLLGIQGYLKLLSQNQNLVTNDSAENNGFSG